MALKNYVSLRAFFDLKVTSKSVTFRIKAYWEKAYKVELENFDDNGDVGEVWFGEDSAQRYQFHHFRNKICLQLFL